MDRQDEPLDVVASLKLIEQAIGAQSDLDPLALTIVQLREYLLELIEVLAEEKDKLQMLKQG